MKKVAGLAFIWGWSFLFIKVAGRGLTPPTVAAVRIALGAGVLLATCRLSGQRLPRDARSWVHFAVMGVTYSALPFTMLAWGEQRTTSALAAVCNATTPLWTAIAVAVMLRERLRAPQIVGLAVGLGGVTLAAGLTGRDIAHSSTAGALAAVGAGVSYGIGTAYARKYLTGLAPTVAATGQLIAALAFAAPPALATSLGAGVHLTATRVVAVTLLGVVGTGFAYAVFYRSIAQLGATRASLVTYLVPVVAVTLGVLLLGERFQFGLLAGGAVIVAGLVLVQGTVPRFSRVSTTSASVLREAGLAAPPPARD